MKIYYCSLYYLICFILSLLSSSIATSCVLQRSNDQSKDFTCSDFVISFRKEKDKRSAFIKCNDDEVKFESSDITPSLSLVDWNVNELKLTITKCSISSEFNSYHEIREIFHRPRIRELIINKLDNLHLAKDSFDEVDELKALKFDTIRKGFSLAPDFFDNMKNLTKLEFISTNINDLSARMFETLSNLEYLNLYSVGLKNISSDFLIGLTNLRTLELSDNPLKTLSANVFNDLINLEVLSMQCNSFELLPEGLLQSNKKLKILKIKTRTKIRKLPAGFLANLTALQEVELLINLEEIDEGIFDGSNNIIKLDLSSNKLIELPEKLLANKFRLKELNLNENEIKEFDWNLFHGAINLEMIKFSRNQISKVKRISSTVGFDILNLKSIDLSFNRLKSFQVPRSLRSLEVLNISSNNLSTPINSLNILVDLKVIDYSRNRFEKLEVNYQMASGNISLNVSYNQITHVVLGVDAKTPISFSIDHNPLACDCGNYLFLKFLKEKNNGKLIFQRADNLLCSSPDQLNGTKLIETNLNDLSSPYHDKEICPENCDCYYKCINKTLIYNCSNSGLEQFPTFRKTSSPSGNEFPPIELHIENNRISALPNRTWLERFNVTKIFATNNSITELQDNQFPRNLKVLHLDYNKLRLINTNALSMNLQDVRLSHNPLNCSCRTFDITNYYKIFSDLQEINCTLSGNVYKLAKLYEDNICEVITELNISLGMTISFFAIPIAIIVIFYVILFKYRKDVVVWLYSKNFCLWLLTEEEVDMEYDAFISYAHDDEEFATKLVQELENGHPKYKVNIHVRDWLAGGAITEQIVESVNSSRRTIILLSENYLNSTWSQMEFRMAYKKTLEDKRVRLIIVICGEIKDMGKVTDELKAYLRTNTYILWDDPWFFKRLKYALPHKPKGVISEIGPIENGISNNNNNDRILLATSQL